MAKIKVLDLAAETGVEDDKLLLKLKQMGLKVKDKKVVEPEKIALPSDEKIIERDSEKEVVEKRVKPTVIRRRTRSLEIKAETPPEVIESKETTLKTPQVEAIEQILPEVKIVEEAPKKVGRPSKKAVEKEGVKKEEKPLQKIKKPKKKIEEIKESPITPEVKVIEEKEIDLKKPPEEVILAEAPPREEEKKVEIEEKVAEIKEEREPIAKICCW